MKKDKIQEDEEEAMEDEKRGIWKVNEITEEITREEWREEGDQETPK